MEPSNEDLRFAEPPAVDGLMPNPLGWEAWTLIGVGVVFLALLIWWIIERSRRKPERDKVNLLKKAHDEAIAALAVCPAEERTPAATECSLLLRRYLVALTGDPALFETHEEWVSRHDAIENLDADLQQQTRSLFSQLAEWKYAPADHGDEPSVVIEHSRNLLEALNREVVA